MKRGIELNGVANLTILLNELQYDRRFQADLESDIKEQLKLLERYMIAYCKAVNDGVEAPQWHEVRDNPTKYPDNRESHGG